MIHVVTQDNRSLYADEFSKLAVLVGASARRRATLEAEEGSVHILSLDPGGTPEFACRLRPLGRRGPVAREMLQLVAGGADWTRDARVLEGSRAFAAPHLCEPGPEAHRRRGELRLGILEEARDMGADRIVEFVEPHQVTEALASGWGVRLLGLPGEMDGLCMVAVEIDASQEAVTELREGLAAGPSRRLRLTPGQTPPSAPPKEIETFLAAAQGLDPAQLEPLLEAMRAAVAEEDGD